MARAAKTNAMKSMAKSASTTSRAKSSVAVAPVASPLLQKGKVVTPQTTTGTVFIAKVISKPVTAVAVRVPPVSKGELRAQLEKLEAVNAALKVKGRQSNRAAKMSARRIMELEAEVAELQLAAAESSTHPVNGRAVKPTRKKAGRPRRAVDSARAIPPANLVVQEEPHDEVAEPTDKTLE